MREGLVHLLWLALSALRLPKRFQTCRHLIRACPTPSVRNRDSSAFYGMGDGMKHDEGEIIPAIEWQESGHTLLGKRTSSVNSFF